MRNELPKIALAVGIGLAMAFTLSCSSSDDNDDPPSGNGNLSSSGGSKPSSSSSRGISSSSGGGESSSKGNDIANYKIKKIGNQVWMAENLNYNVPNSKCYGEGAQVAILDENDYPIDLKTLTDEEVQANCVKYGRLYDWATAMNFSSICNSTTCANQIQQPHRGICPEGWHIPSNGEWDELFRFVDKDNDGEGEERERYYQSRTAGKYLKSATGWDDYKGTSGNGIDKYNFSAFRPITYYSDYAYWHEEDKSLLFSVRCVKNN